MRDISGMASSRPPLTVNLGVGARLLGIHRTTAYEAAKTGQLADGVPVLRVNNRYRVPTRALARALGVDVDDLPLDADEPATAAS